MRERLRTGMYHPGMQPSQLGQLSLAFFRGAKSITLLTYLLYFLAQPRFTHRSHCTRCLKTTLHTITVTDMKALR